MQHLYRATTIRFATLHRYFELLNIIGDITAIIFFCHLYLRQPAVRISTDDYDFELSSFTTVLDERGNYAIGIIDIVMARRIS